MKTIEYSSENKTLLLTEKPIPKIKKPDDILLKVAFSGISKEDVQLLDGNSTLGKLGYEISGTVEDIGIDVKDFKKGDTVAVHPKNFCMLCNYCQLGKHQFCQDTDSYSNRGFEEFIVAPAHLVHKLPDKVTPKQAALAFPLSRILHGYDELSPIADGSKILLLSANFQSVLWANVLYLKGYRDITICDNNIDCLNFIKQSVVFKIVTLEQLKAKQANDEKLAFNFEIDCGGDNTLINYSIRLLQRGGKFYCFGPYLPEDEIRINPFNIFLHEFNIGGIKYNPDYFSKSLHLIQTMGDSYLDEEKLGIKAYNAEKYAIAFADLIGGNILKPILKFN